MIHLPDLLELLRSVLKNGDFLVDSEHGLISRAILLHLLVHLNWVDFLNCVALINLDESILHEVIVFSFVPLLWIFDFDPVEPADPHELVAFFFLPLE
jgi:hypothetical protein